jgi:deoxyadenosine/deoxycytidine kinase
VRTRQRRPRTAAHRITGTVVEHRRGRALDHRPVAKPGAPATSRYIARVSSPDSLPFRYLAVDGPIGVGKTTLVEMLSRRYEGVKMLEDVENPFLADFYQDRPGTAFQTELYFLLSRYKQQLDAVQHELFQRLLLADYTFAKNRIFAYLNLSDDELMLFDKLYQLLVPQVPKPDLVLFLTADRETCMARIRRRARSFERDMSPDYMAQLIDAYNHYYYHYSDTPLLVVDTRHLDFEHRSDDFEELTHILARPPRGTQYFVPAGRR